MKRLGVFLLPPGSDVSPSQGYTWVKRGTVRIKNTTPCPWQGLELGPLDPEATH